MHFLLTAYDGVDNGAQKRRNESRMNHLENVKRLIKEGRHLYGAAILDDTGKMIGSVMLVDYLSKKELESDWLKNEPYVVNNVWEKIEICPCIIPDFFLNKEI